MRVAEEVPVLLKLQCGLRRLNDPSKWVKGSFDRSGSYCILTACDCTINKWDNRVHDRLLASIRVLFPNHGHSHSSVTIFNDRCATYDDVIEVLHHAIRTEEQCQS